jgi:uncharacterized protein YecT (DUF1311 family)
MKNYLIALIVMALLNGCAKKGEDQLIGKWSFSATVTDRDDKPQAFSCNIEFKKDSTYKEDCLVDYTNDEAKGSMRVSTFGDWIYKKEEKSDGYFLIKPKEREAKVIAWKQKEMNFSEVMLKEMNDQDFFKQKDKLSADSEIKFTVISEKNSKLFIQIDSSSEDEFPIGSFSMEKYDEKNDKVKSSIDSKTPENKVSKPAASNPTPSKAEAPDVPVVPAPEINIQPIKPSFDCTKASTRAEKMVCGNSELATLDQEMATNYKKAIDAVKENNYSKNELKNEQIAWLKTLKLCPDEACLAQSYKQRNNDLRSYFAGD